jgi:membrane fusion protein, multidrug efflux system
MPFFTKKRMIYSVIAIILIALLNHYYSHSTKGTQSTTIAVTVSPVQQKDVTIRSHAIGNVEPYVTVSVKSRVDGQLLSVGFKEGDFVKEGQIIFQIDPQPFRVALQQAEANLAKDQAQLNNYKKTLERYVPLMKKGYVSKQEYDQAEANSKGQEAAVMADKAAVDNAQLNLGYCTIRASISGRTGNLLVNPGNLVKASDTSPLVVINQVTPVYITFSLPEQQLNSIQHELKDGLLPVYLQIKEDPAESLQGSVVDHAASLEGKVSFVDNTVDSSTGMIKLKAIFENQDEELWPGEYVDVTVPYTTLHQALLVPTRAIQASPEGAYVFVVGKNASVTLKSIKAGVMLEDHTVIEGLTPGEVVVLTGQAQLVDGSIVNSSLDESTLNSSLAGSIAKSSAAGNTSTSSLGGSVTNSSVAGSIAKSSAAENTSTNSLGGSVANNSVAGSITNSSLDGNIVNHSNNARSTG